MAAPVPIYPDGDTIDHRRPWTIWLDYDATRNALHVQIRSGSTVVWDTHENIVHEAPPEGGVLAYRAAFHMMSDLPLTPGATYSYRVRAGFTGGGGSGWSSDKSFTVASSSPLRPMMTFSDWLEQQ